ncbi:START domain-containing protein [Aestuariibacter sp. AA17]|uniref:START domain-containing protein n=1 Tax=Fluctibacter corallii TaxID=2984329 RepID=A0ABT3A915_9ALTE|nr:START domain-containing protein [Aestuariibacter sp. AA17]MCV2885173.1 START domain-containing protein [Aestuariibacter sp. AA17]
MIANFSTDMQLALRPVFAPFLVFFLLVTFIHPLSAKEKHHHMLANPISSQTTQGWNIEKQNQNVVVMSRQRVQGVFEIQAITFAKAKSTALLALLDDTDAATEWITHAKSVDVLDWFGHSERTVKTVFNAPWPFSDRDMITRSIAEYDSNIDVLTINIENQGDRYPTQSHLVRIQHVQGQWRVYPTSHSNDDSMVIITYQGSADAGGSIPEWLANHLAISSIFTTFIQLQKKVANPKYQKVQITD